MLVRNQWIIFAENSKGTTFTATQTTKLMEKEKLLSELKTRVGTTALSDRTIDEYATSILPTVTSDEMVNDAFWTAHTAILKSFEGNLNHEVANRVNVFKSEWEKNHPQTPPPPQDPPKDDKYETLLKEIEGLKKANEESQKKSAIESLRTQALSKGNELNISNANLWKDCVNAARIGDDATFESVLSQVKGDYEARLKSYFGDGAMPYGGSQSPQRVSKESANAKREAFKEKMRSQGKLPK